MKDLPLAADHRKQRHVVHCRSRLELDAVLATLPPGGAFHLLILHDDGCRPGACACEPEYEVEPLSVASWQRGAELERKWRARA